MFPIGSTYISDKYDYLEDRLNDHSYAKIVRSHIY